jgi:hypothetical protein
MATGDVQLVLDRIASMVRECGREIATSVDNHRIVHKLTECKSNLQRVAPSVNSEVVRTINDAIDELLQIVHSQSIQETAYVDVSTESQPASVLVQRGVFRLLFFRIFSWLCQLFCHLSFMQQCIIIVAVAKSLMVNGLVVTGRGRPMLPITDEQLRALYAQGFTGSSMAQLLNCSSSYIYARLSGMNKKFRDRYSDISDTDLISRISELQETSPDSGVQVQPSLHILTYCFTFLKLCLCL